MTKVIGLISGTSVDGIDAALVEVTGTTYDLQVELLNGMTYPYPPLLREQILAVGSGLPLSMADLAALDDAIAYHFAQAALAVQENDPPAVLIGSHGQTVYHRPPQPIPAQTGAGSRSALAVAAPPGQAVSMGYSLQLGRGAAIADLTGITTVSNFRAADIAAGGQGAPLVSAVDAWLLRHPTCDRCFQNIGGIGNVTYLPASAQMNFEPSANAPLQDSHQPSSSILGWDTGPGNMLLDLAVQRLTQGQQTYDRDGAWAAQGKPCDALVQQWLQQEFFQLSPPKSTGREAFGADYLEQCWTDAEPYALSPADLLATLTELTVASIVQSYRQFLPRLPDQVLLGGGGGRNLYLKQRLQAHLHPALVTTTDELGLNADYKEAIAFAVLAYWRTQGIPGNLPEVTGAHQSVLLGEIHLAA